MELKCDICKKIFRSQYILDKHINKKESCIKQKENDITTKLNRLNKYILTRDNSIDNPLKKCLYCQNSFSTKGNLKNHIYSHCEIRKKKIENLEKLKDELNQINENVKIYEDDEYNNVSDEDCELDETLDNKTLRKMLHKLTKEVEKLSSKQLSSTPQTIQTQNNANKQQIIENQNNNNITNNIQINQINLNNYDNPNCDFLTIEQKNKFLKDRYKGLIDFITYVYFNESYPENHTILYTNLRSKFGHIYKNNKWMVEEIDMIADKLNDYSFDKLSEHLDTIKENNDETIKYDKDIEKGEKFIEHYTSNDTTKQARTNIKKIIYNNKDLVTKTKELKESTKSKK